MAYHASERLHRAEQGSGDPNREKHVRLKLFALFAGPALGAPGIRRRDDEPLTDEDAA